MAVEVMEPMWYHTTGMSEQNGSQNLTGVFARALLMCGEPRKNPKRTALYTTLFHDDKQAHCALDVRNLLGTKSKCKTDDD